MLNFLSVVSGNPLRSIPETTDNIDCRGNPLWLPSLGGLISGSSC